LLSSLDCSIPLESPFEKLSVGVSVVASSEFAGF
jgi:hypothetical protein